MSDFAWLFGALCLLAIVGAFFLPNKEEIENFFDNPPKEVDIMDDRDYKRV